jgi:hypothetical protein
VYVIEDGEKFREPGLTLQIGFHRHGIFTWRLTSIGYEEVLTGKYENLIGASGLRIRFRGALSEVQKDRLSVILGYDTVSKVANCEVGFENELLLFVAPRPNMRIYFAKSANNMANPGQR